MKTYLIKIPHDNEKTAAAFEELLTQLHEGVLGEKVAFEISKATFSPSTPS